jgi:hypothetical protein
MAMGSSSTNSTAVTTTISILNAATTSGPTHSETNSITGQTILPTPAEATPIFLETKAAQGIAGAFVWIALFLTCHQVCCDEFTTYCELRRTRRINYTFRVTNPAFSVQLYLSLHCCT